MLTSNEIYTSPEIAPDTPEGVPLTPFPTQHPGEGPVEIYS